MTRSQDDGWALLAALQTWAQRNLPAPESGHGGPECQWCPLCQLASMLRGENPEIADGLADSVAALVAAAGSVLEAVSRRAAPGARRPRPTSARVEKIELDET